MDLRRRRDSFFLEMIMMDYYVWFGNELCTWMSWTSKFCLLYRVLVAVTVKWRQHFHFYHSEL